MGTQAYYAYFTCKYSDEFDDLHLRRFSRVKLYMHTR